MVLMPGDLFDSGEPSIDDLNFLISTVNSMGPTPVFIAPGAQTVAADGESEVGVDESTADESVAAETAEESPPT